jgi:hypothetical protein
LTALTQQWSDHAFQQHCNDKEEKYISLTALAAYINNTVQGMQISNYKKSRILSTITCPEIHEALPKGVELPMFNSLLEACLYIKSDVCLEAYFKKGQMKTATLQKALDKLR